MEAKKKKALVALSGGVDSSVSAALLQEQGYVVEGAFIRTWTVPWMPCTWRDERRDAMRVAAHLQIPFHTIDLSKEYERDVANYMIEEYKKGRTPNPDVMCNKYVKFGGLYDWAMENGFDYIATGHYARTDGATLRAGLDTNKDQTYFLWTLTPDILAHTLFPVGEYEKSKVREFARTFKLPTAEKKDSQGVCFLGKLDMKEFLTHYIDTKPGDVLDNDGNVIGTHDGAVFLTLGQRHGFTITQKGPDTPPLYVTAKGIEKNTITVAPREQTVPKVQENIHLTDMNWISQPSGNKVQARLRYRQTLFPVTLKNNDNTSCDIVPDTPQPFIPKGQSVVLYHDDVVLGGGIIT